jgi:hypothetical protein
MVLRPRPMTRRPRGPLPVAVRADMTDAQWARRQHCPFTTTQRYLSPDSGLVNPRPANPSSHLAATIAKSPPSTEQIDFLRAPKDLNTVLIWAFTPARRRFDHGVWRAGFEPPTP